jgi:hypothetical protein
MLGWTLAPAIVSSLLAIPKLEEIPTTLSNGRRNFLHTVVTVSSVSTLRPRPAVAETAVSIATADSTPGSAPVDDKEPMESLKPFAPVSALLPATRARIWIEEAFQISASLTNNQNNSKDQIQTLERLNQVLSNRPPLFQKGEKLVPRVGSTALAQFTAKKSNTKLTNMGQQQDVNSQDPFASGPSLADKFSRALNQADVARQWGILQAQESRTESQNELRAAWNYYTQQLEFNPSSYEWKASAEEKKRRIRNDQLPTPQAVIVSDLDLRDLYRNQLLTALDDATAEVQYQLKQQQGDNALDVTDIVDLMNQAHTACTKWFDMIDKRDVKEAEIIVLKE